MVPLRQKNAGRRTHERLQVTILHGPASLIAAERSDLFLSNQAFCIFLVHFLCSSQGSNRGLFNIYSRRAAVFFRREEFPQQPATARLLDHQQHIRNVQQLNRIMSSLQLATDRDAYEEHKAPGLPHYITYLLLTMGTRMRMCSSKWYACSCANPNRVSPNV